MREEIIMTKPTLPLDNCTACGACVSRCPQEAIKLIENTEGFFSTVVNEKLCMGCKLCEKACHVLSASVEDLSKEGDAYGVPYILKAKDKDIVAKSSSGGVFSLLSEIVMKNGGCVYGARYNYETETLECSSTDECDINELRKSKYVESYMGSTFKSICAKLKEGRQVLYCGTPCQVKGLQHYLRSCKCSMDNLLTVRFICHGVPSNKFFREYKHHVEKKYKAKATHIDFRPKDFGWRTHNLHIKFKNGKILKELSSCNLYFTSFYSSDMLRPSCYQCNLINEDDADLTIADFWGIHMYAPQNKDQEGISLVISHNEKGFGYLNQIFDKCNYEKLPNSAIEYIFKRENYQRKLDCRPDLMRKVHEKGYVLVALEMYGKTCRRNKIKMYAKTIVRKVLPEALFDNLRR